MWKNKPSSELEFEWRLACLSLSDIHLYWASAAATAATSGAHWKDPLNLGTDCPLPLQWTLPLSNSISSSKDREHQVQDSVAAACLDTTSDPSQPAIRLAARRSGTVLNVSLKAFSKHLSSSTSSSSLSAAAGALGGDSGVVSDSRRTSCASLLSPAPQVYVWSIGKLVYVLSESGVLHQCAASGTAAPQHVGECTLLQNELNFCFGHLHCVTCLLPGSSPLPLDSLYKTV